MFLYVPEAKATVASAQANAGDVVWLTVPEEPVRLAIEARAGVDIVAYSGVPIDEAVVTGGPFVAGSRAELEKAFDDLERSRFP